MTINFSGIDSVLDAFSMEDLFFVESSPLPGEQQKNSEDTESCRLLFAQSPLTCVKRRDLLHVKKIEFDDYPVVKLIIDVWKKIAQQKAECAKTSTEKNQFSDCKFILDIISCEMNSKKESYYQLFMCNDAQGNPQGMMQIKDGKQGLSLSVASLVTNPINIRSPLNANETKRAMGVGSCLLEAAEQVAREKEKVQVRLTPIFSSVVFYQKNGFVADEYSFDMIKTVLSVSRTVTPYFEQSVA